jgi:hypothetical protein
MSKGWSFSGRGLGTASLAVALMAAAMAAQGQEQASGGPSPLVFIDSKVFDAQLAKELERNKRVELQIEGRLSINQIPARLDKWLAKVAESGALELRQQDAAVRNKSLFALVSMVFPALQGMQEERLLSNANRYNAIVYYRKDASGDALIDRVVFLPR